MKSREMMEEPGKYIPAESDDRTGNNALRHQYGQLSDAEKQQMVELKDLGAALRA